MLFSMPKVNIWTLATMLQENNDFGINASEMLLCSLNKNNNI